MELQSSFLTHKVPLWLIMEWRIATSSKQNIVQKDIHFDIFFYLLWFFFSFLLFFFFPFSYPCWFITFNFYFILMVFFITLKAFITLRFVKISRLLRTCNSSKIYTKTITLSDVIFPLIYNYQFKEHFLIITKFIALSRAFNVMNNNYLTLTITSVMIAYEITEKNNKHGNKRNFRDKGIYTKI